MNKRELIIKRKETASKYHIGGMPNFARRKPNSVHLNPHNTIQHELKKTEVCYNLQKEKKQFITEAVDNKTNLRRDIICLDDGIVHEIENSKSYRGHRHSPEIQVWWYDLGRERTYSEAKEDFDKKDL